MKIKDLRDDETVYVILTKDDNFLINIAHLTEETCLIKLGDLKEVFPKMEINICKTVASDLPRDFDVYERTEE